MCVIGSGKTYNMMGDESNIGLIPRLIEDLYDTISTLSTTNNTNNSNSSNNTTSIQFLTSISFLEIYNEEIKVCGVWYGVYGMWYVGSFKPFLISSSTSRKSRYRYHIPHTTYHIPYTIYPIPHIPTHSKNLV